MQRPLEISLLRTFVMLVEERSVTRVAQRLHRTQPAVSLQIRRLEDAVGRPLFEPNLRHLRLSTHGEILLSYARSLLSTHDEAYLRLSSDEVEGRVSLGCPEIYASFVLPETLARFRNDYPKVEVTVQCALTRQLAQAMDEGQVDVAVATQMSGVAPKGGEISRLRSEALVWVGAEDGNAYKRDPIPLAMLPEGNLHRDLALMALHQAGRRWRIACVSDSLAGLQAMALSDSAVIVVAKSVRAVGLLRLGPESGLPQLPDIDLMLWRRRPNNSQAANQLAAQIEVQVGAPAA